MWYDFDSRYNVKLYRDPSIYNNLPYKKLVSTEKLITFDFVKIIRDLLSEYSKTSQDISHVVYTENNKKYQCSYDDFLSYLKIRSDFRDILDKDIVIKGHDDWWIRYESQGFWDFYLIKRPTIG
jgi:hypothetical protein